MKVLLACEAFGRIGGVEEVVDNLAVQFVASGHIVSVVSNPYSYPACENTSRAPVQLFELSIPSAKPVSLRHLERIIRRPRAREFEQVLRRVQPHVVGAHFWNWDRFPPFLHACKSASVPVVVSLYDTSGRGKLKEAALLPLTQAAALTAVSNATWSDFEKLMPAGCKAHVIPAGVNYAEAQAAIPHSRARPYVFCAARLDLRHKAIDTLIAAFRIIAPEYHEIDLVIAGDGPDGAQLKREVEDSALGARVEFVGAVSRSDLWSLHGGALFFAMPSRMREGLGIVFLEAMACGRAVIGRNIGGVSEVIAHGETGLMIENDEPQELASSMRQLAADHELRERMGRRARQVVAAGYSWDQVAARYLEVYEAAAKR